MRLAALTIGAGMIALAGCRGGTSSEPPIVPFRGMHEMPRYDAQERAAYFEDHRAMRQQVEGTVSREMEVSLEVESGLDANGEYIAAIPTQVVERGGGLATLLERGQQRYNIYCAPCHSPAGDGNGMVSQRASELGVAFAAANLGDPQFQHMPDGRLYATIANGVRTMPAYRAQLPVTDRWAIVAYVRALQLSQGDAAAAMEDTDHDQIPAGADGCGNEAEDRDGFQDLDGCPDPDNDGDGVLDAVDACPLSPAPTGCAGLATLDETGLHVEAVRFERVLDGRALAIVDEVRSVMVAHPEVARVIVEGHATATGAPERQRAASEAQAITVARWLVEHGIPAERLQPVGAGGGPERRVDFRIDVPVEAAAPAAAGVPGGV